MHKQSISVTVITLNEEENIARCLASISAFADEIIVVDSGSTDKTTDIAKKFKAKIYTRKFDNYANQKNFAASKAEGEWIFALDADEVVSSELALEIKKVVRQEEINGFLIPRRNFIFGAEIKHTRWSPDAHIWLWRRGKGIWEGGIHEEVKVDGWVGQIKEAKIHYQYKKVGEFWDMMNDYTERIAEEDTLQGKKFSYFMLFYSPLLSFFRRFFYKKGYLDGWRGFILSYLMAIYRMTTWIKIWERKKGDADSNNNISYGIYLFIIIIMAFILRLIVINQSLWLDEAIGAIAVKNFTYRGLISYFLTSDNHPPLYYFILKYWTSLFGYTEVVMRLPSLIFGVGTVLLTYLVGKRISGGLNSLFPVFAALFIATSPFHIYYSQEARMYSMAAFFVILTFYFLLVAIEKNKIIHWLLFSLSLTAMILTDYVPIFMIPVFWIIVLGKKNLKLLYPFILAHILILILGMWWLPTFLIQIKKGNWLLSVLPGWRKIAGGATLKQAGLVWMKFVFGRITFINKPFYYITVLIASIPFLHSLVNSIKKARERYLFWLWLVIPLVAGFIASLWAPIFIYFRFLYVIPAFYLLVASGLGDQKNIRLRNVLFVLILSVNFTGLGVYYINKNQQREEWRQVTRWIDTNAGDKETIIFNYPEPFAPYRWYTNNKTHSFGVADSIAVDPLKTRQRTERVISRVNSTYYFNYLEDLTDPKGEVVNTLKDNGFVKSESYSFIGVGEVSYWIKK